MKYEIGKRILGLTTATMVSILPTTQVFGLENFNEVNKAGNKGDSLVEIEIVNDGIGGGTGETTIFSAYVPSLLPIKVDEDGNVHTPSNAVIVNGVETKGIQVKDIEAHLDYEWEAEDWNTDFDSLPVNSKKLGLKLREDTLSSNGDFSINTEDWKIPKDSYIDLNMKAKLPPQEIAARSSKVSDGAVLSFLLDWSGDDTTTGPKWNGGNEEGNPDIPSTDESNIKGSSTDTIVVGETGNVMFNWDTKGDTILIDSIISSNEEVATIGSITGEEGNKIVQINGLKAGKTIITAKLNNKEIANFEVEVYQVDENKEIQIEVADKEFSVGNKLSSNDVTVKVPLLTSDGSNKYIEVVPSIEDTALKVGNNSLTGTITIGDNTYNITIEITISNPSNDLTLSVEEAQAVGFTFASYHDGLEITGFENKQFKSSIDVPEQIGDFKVIRVGDNAFEGQTNIVKINLPASVIELGDSAFSGCSSLKDIEIEGKLSKIGPRVFLDCTGLTNIILNLDDNCEMVSTIQSKIRINGGFETGRLTITPFMGCSNLNSVTIKSNAESLPALFTTILLYPTSVTLSGFNNVPLSTSGSYDESVNGKYYLNNCNFEVKLECDNLKSIGDYMFHNSGVTDIDIPESVTSINKGAFQQCRMLNNIKLSDNVTSIGAGAFSYCVKFTDLPISSNITSIGRSAFSNCVKLTNISIPGSVTVIDEYTFDGCNSLERVDIENGVTRINKWAFRSCTKLTEINIPQSITFMGEQLFQYIYNHDITINIDKESGTISGKPWGASSATINWLNDTETWGH